MSEPSLYLKPDVAFEPLIGDWYAWAYIVAPHTAGMYFRNYYLPVMDSFISNPRVHALALQDPGSAGGPFMAFPAERQADVQQARDRLAHEQQDLLRLAEDARMLDKLLEAEATGGALHGLYPKVPDGLRGLVELSYDLRNVPSFRFIEGALYRSRYYQEGAQSLLLAAHGDTRPFVFSTPRLDTANGVRLRVPFRSEIVDALARLREQPIPRSDVAALLDGAIEPGAPWEHLFTEDRPCREHDAEYRGTGLRVRYFSHACMLLQSGGHSMLLDPLIPYRADRHERDRLSYADLPDHLDAAFITHNHQDHVMFETLLQLRHRLGTIYVPKSSGRLPDISLKHALRATGFANVEELDEYDSVRLGPLTVTGLPFFGEHADLDIRSKLAYGIRAGSRSVICVADSNSLEPRLYDYVRDAVGEPDLLCLGMECDGAPLSWLYGALLPRPLARSFDQSRRTESSDFALGRQMVRVLRPKKVFVYAMGLEPWLTFVTSASFSEDSRPIVESDRLIADCRGAGIDAMRLFGRAELILE